MIFDVRNSLIILQVKDRSLFAKRKEQSVFLHERYPDSFEVSTIVSTMPAWLPIQVLIIAPTTGRTLIELRSIIPLLSISRTNNYSWKRRDGWDSTFPNRFRILNPSLLSACHTFCIIVVIFYERRQANEIKLPRSRPCRINLHRIWNVVMSPTMRFCLIYNSTVNFASYRSGSQLYGMGAHGKLFWIL